MPFIPLSELVENFNDFHLVDIHRSAQFREGHLPHAQKKSFPFRNEQLPVLMGQWQKMRDLHPDQLIENYDQTKQYSFYAASPWLELDGEKKSPEDLAKKILEAVQL